MNILTDIALGYGLLLSGIALRWAWIDCAHVVSDLRDRWDAHLEETERRIKGRATSGLPPKRFEPVRLKMLDFGVEGAHCRLDMVRLWQRKVRQAKVTAWNWPDVDFDRTYREVGTYGERPTSVNCALECLARSMAGIQGGGFRNEHLIEDEEVRKAAEELAVKRI